MLGNPTSVCGILRSLTSNCWVTQSCVFATNSSLFVSQAEGILVDPGIMPQELDALSAFIAANNIVLRGLILTHAHWDHLLGVTHFPGVPIFVHAAYHKVLRTHTDDLQRQVVHWQKEARIESSTPFMPPTPTCTFTEQVVLSIGAQQLQVIAAPGHAPDHCAIYEPKAGVLFAGDMLSDVEVPMVMDTFAAYQHTLQRLSVLDIRGLIPGHGRPTLNHAEIRGRFAQDQAYLSAVNVCAKQAVAQGALLDETVMVCSKIPFSQPDDYPNAHIWNIEQAYVEAGGRIDYLGRLVGWEQDWVVQE